MLAIDPTSRGFGFVVLEGGSKLLDWGTRSIRDDKTEKTLAKVRELLELYRPAILVVEDCDDPLSRRAPRIRILIERLTEEAAALNVRPQPVAVAKVVAFFGREGARTKHQIADAIVRRFPELATYRPPRRKPWMSEDERQAVFDAVGFVLALANHIAPHRR